MIFLGFSSDLVSSRSFSSCSRSPARSRFSRMPRIASAPMPAVNASSPYSSLRVEELVLRQQLAVLERGQARLGDDVVLEIEHALQLLQLHVEQQADAAGQRLQEPDVGDGGGQFDVAHALAADLGDGDLDPALLADDAFVLHALVLAAQALVIFDRPEDARAEQAISLRLEGPVVDRLRLLDLAEGPADRIFSGEARPIWMVSNVSGLGAAGVKGVMSFIFVAFRTALSEAANQIEALLIAYSVTLRRNQRGEGTA